jgi:predicted MPP superfamily phosphohydrolase
MNHYLLTITIAIFTILSIGSAYAEKSNTIDTNSIQQNLDNTPIATDKMSSSSFNIAVAADWGCKEDAKKTSKNIQDKNPELVIAAGDLSYKGQGDCWENIISPFESKLKVSMGDHEYHDTEGGKTGVVNEYLNPLDIVKTYYSFDLNNVHFVFIDPYLDYKPGSEQYQFIENDLKTASTNTNTDWTFVVEHIPMYTSPSKHSANSTIRDIYHPLFDKYGVDLVFSGDNHNYQRTFPLKYNNQDNSGDSSTNPIISNKDKNNYNADTGVIYLITGTAGRSLYEIKEQAPFVAKQDDKDFGFLNIDIDNQSLKGTFYKNENEKGIINIDFQNNQIADHFTISKTTDSDNKALNL